MRLKRTVAALGTCAAGIGLTLGLSPQAMAVDHWDPGYIRYPHVRDVRDSVEWHGAVGSVRISWGSYTQVSLSGWVKDTRADGRGATVQVSYYWYDSGAWEYEVKTFISASGGVGDVRKNAQHTTAEIKDLEVRFCTVKGADESCTPWA
ncbi:hypothetical protein [Streptomyces sp. SD31]|uniref:hypothetical protein n=1 Tax=Streptomyces sp. SD31 TaxID=3452208 RepID=UPI003F894E5D